MNTQDADFGGIGFGQVQRGVEGGGRILEREFCGESFGELVYGGFCEAVGEVAACDVVCKERVNVKKYLVVQEGCNLRKRNL